MAELVLHRLPQPTVYLLVMEQGPQVKAREMPKGPKIPRKALQNRKDTSSLQCFRCQGWGHMAWECAIPAKTLNQSGGNKPHQHQSQEPTVGSQHSLPDPKPKLTILKVAQKKG